MRPIPQTPFATGVTPRISSSPSTTNFLDAMTKAAGKVARLSCGSLIICSDWGTASFQCQTSTFAWGSVVAGGSGSCSLIPTKSFVPSFVHCGVANSLSTIPFGNPSAFDGSNCTGAPGAFPRLVHARSMLSFCLFSFFFSPRNTARFRPSALHERASKSDAAVARTRVSPVAG